MIFNPRDLSYVQSYSQFRQAQATANQPTWRVELDQYCRAVEVEHQCQEKGRIALWSVNNDSNKNDNTT